MRDELTRRSRAELVPAGSLWLSGQALASAQERRLADLFWADLQRGTLGRRGIVAQESDGESDGENGEENGEEIDLDRDPTALSTAVERLAGLRKNRYHSSRQSPRCRQIIPVKAHQSHFHVRKMPTRYMNTIKLPTS